jgi:hypothetical protein
VASIERASPTLEELRGRFEENGRSLHVELSTSRWIARYPEPGHSFRAGPAASGRTAREAALAAWEAFIETRHASVDGER